MHDGNREESTRTTKGQVGTESKPKVQELLFTANPSSKHYQGYAP